MGEIPPPRVARARNDGRAPQISMLTVVASFVDVILPVAVEGTFSYSVPLALAPVPPEMVSTVTRLIESLEEHDDVKEVYANAEFGGGAT